MGQSETEFIQFIMTVGNGTMPVLSCDYLDIKQEKLIQIPNRYTFQASNKFYERDTISELLKWCHPQLLDRVSRNTKTHSIQLFCLPRMTI